MVGDYDIPLLKTLLMKKLAKLERMSGCKCSFVIEAVH